MFDLAGAISLGAITVGAYMVLLYVLSMIKRDTSIVDIGWGLGFVLVAISLCIGQDVMGQHYGLVRILVGVWGIRLFLHILMRKAGKPEDWRYAKWREEWGSTHWWRSFLQVFMLQGVLMMVIAAPLFVASASSGSQLNALAWVGAAVWALGFFFESVGDYQLTQFLKKKTAKKKSSKKSKKEKKSKRSVMQSGLWKYTRHPNYFGEVTQWWGLFIIVVSLSNGWWAVVSPLTITFLLLKVSGITMLEKRFEDDKEFQKYKKRTSAFFPMPPKK